MSYFRMLFFTCVAGSMVSVSGFSDISPVPGTRPTSPINKPDAATSGQRSAGNPAPAYAGPGKNAKPQAERLKYKTEVRQSSSGNREYTIRSERFGRVEITQRSAIEYYFKGSSLDGSILADKDGWIFSNNEKKGQLRRVAYGSERFTATFLGFREGTAEVTYDLDGLVMGVTCRGENGRDLLAAKRVTGDSWVFENIGFPFWPNPVIRVAINFNNPNAKINVQYADDRGWMYSYEGDGDMILFSQALASAYSEKDMSQEDFQKFMDRFMNEGNGRYLRQVTDQTDAALAAFSTVIEAQEDVENLKMMRD